MRRVDEKWATGQRNHGSLLVARDSGRGRQRISAHGSRATDHEPRDASGFTLLEVLIASAVLSTALILVVGALAQMHGVSVGLADRIERFEAVNMNEVENGLMPWAQNQ